MLCVSWATRSRRHWAIIHLTWRLSRRWRSCIAALPCVISIGMGDRVLFKDEELGREISLANSPWCELFIDGEI